MDAVEEHIGTTANSLPRATRRRIFATIAACSWMLILVFGAVPLWIYGATSGPDAEALRRWPSDSGIAHLPGKATLLVFAHPKCPCTAATLTELRAVLSRFAAGLDAVMVFVQPDGVSEEWCHDDLWRSASAIPDLRRAIDPGGREAQRFGARTSGHVMLYSADTELLFSGGITHARGDAGDDAHAKLLIDAILTGRPPHPLGSSTADRVPLHAPVFGCLLMEDAR